MSIIVRERMAGADAAWLHMDRPDNPMIVNTLLAFDEAPDWDAVLDAVNERVVKPYRRFRQRPSEPVVTLGAIGPRWVHEKSVDLRAHVIRVDLDDPSSTFHSLDAYVGHQAGRPLDRSRPMWQAHCITGPGAGAALLLRTHHAIADGAALVKVITQLTDPTEPAPPAAGSTSRPGRRPGRRPVAALAREGATLAKLGGRLVPGARARGTSLAGSKEVTHSAPVPIGRLKAVGAETGSTVNDVMLATVAGALRRYRRATGTPTDDLDVVVPVSVRRPDAEPADALGNRFGLVFATLPVSAGDIHTRLTRVTTQMRTIKGSREAEVVFGALATMGRVPPAAERGWVDAFVGDAGAVITNIAGPSAAVTLAGTPVTRLVLWVPSTGPIGLGVSLLSYDGAATIGLISDTAVVPDVTRLAAALDEELDALPGA